MHTDYSEENYRENAKRQLCEWVRGNPIHNPLSPLGPEHSGPLEEDGECTPDFSCCAPEMLCGTTVDQRRAHALDLIENVEWITAKDLFSA